MSCEPEIATTDGALETVGQAPYRDPVTGVVLDGVSSVAGDDLELVEHPPKVARIEINYARTAKMINVRRLKTAIWDLVDQQLHHSPIPHERADSSLATFPQLLQVANSDVPMQSPISCTEQQTSLIRSTSDEVLAKELSPKSRASNEEVSCHFSKLLDTLPSQVHL
ncbi:unnamed protein product, partial [Protopolystoma xenopodis]